MFSSMAVILLYKRSTYSATVSNAQIEIVFVASVVMVAVLAAYQWILNGQHFDFCTLIVLC